MAIPESVYYKRELAAEFISSSIDQFGDAIDRALKAVENHGDMDAFMSSSAVRVDLWKSIISHLEMDWSQLTESKLDECAKRTRAKGDPNG